MSKIRFSILCASLLVAGGIGGATMHTIDTACPTTSSGPDTVIFKCSGSTYDNARTAYLFDHPGYVEATAGDIVGVKRDFFGNSFFDTSWEVHFTKATWIE